MLADSAARWVLVLHTALGVAAVAASTHLVIWLRRYLRGLRSRRATQKFAVIALALHAAAFLAGNVMYPTYKVEVRAAYLENPGAVIAQHDSHEREVDKLAAREHVGHVEQEPAAEAIRRAARTARWFDVKEHWIALGLIGSLALVLILLLWDPDRDGRAPVPIVVGLAWLVAGTLWLGAIIGVLTAAARAV